MSLVQVLGLQHLGAQTRTHRNLDLGEVELLRLARFGLHLFIALEARLVLRLACLGR